MLFDQFTAAQAGNGQSGPPNQQQVHGSPNFQLGNWGNVPPNLAGGLQNFMQRQQPGAMPQRPNVMPLGPPPMTGGGGGIVPPGPPAPGGVGMQVGPGMGTGPMTAGAMPPGQMPPNVVGAGQPPSYAGGMQQFLGMRR